MRVEGDWALGETQFNLTMEKWPEGQVAPIVGSLRLVAPRSGVVKASPELLKTRPLQDATGVFPLAFSPDGKLLAAGTEKELFLLDAESLEARHRLALGAKGRLNLPMVRFAPDGKRLYVPIYDQVKQIERGPDGGYAWMDWQGEVKAFDTATGKEASTLRRTPSRAVTHLDVLGTSLLARSELWRAGAYNPKTQENPIGQALSVLRLADGKELWSRAGPGRAVFFPDGKRLLVVDKETALLDATTGAELAKLPAPEGPLDCFDFALSANSRWLGVTSGFSRLLAWDLQAKAPPRTLFTATGQQRPVRLAFSPDGKLLALAVNDDKAVRDPSRRVPGRILLFDVETGKERKALTGHTGQVYALCFSPDGKTLATGGFDGTVRLWDLSGVK